MVASVARNGLTLRFVTSRPLIAPTRAPKPSAVGRIQTRSASSPENEVATTAEVAITDATDRSRPRTRITSICPITTMPSGANCKSMFARLLAVNSAGAAIAAPTKSIAPTRASTLLRSKRVTRDARSERPPVTATAEIEVFIRFTLVALCVTVGK